MPIVNAASTDRVAYVRELERRDEGVSQATDRIDQLAAHVADLRIRVATLRASIDGLPEARQLAEGAEQAAVAEEQAAQEALDEVVGRVARLEQGRRRRQDELDQARRELRRATEELADARVRVERTRERRRQVDEDERALAAAAEGAVVEARSLAHELRDAPRLPDAGRGDPGSSLGELEEWGGQARAALFVARGVLTAERERLVAEAAALGAAALGESFAGSSVTLIRRRIEAAGEADDTLTGS